MRTFHAVLLICAIAVAAVAQERRIKRSQLPAAVEKTVVAENKGATIRGFSAEKENGQIYYEVEMTVDGHSRDVLIDSAGTVVELEQEVAIDSLPDAVRKGLQAKAGIGKLGKIESITKHDKLVAYEAKVTVGSNKSEVQVGPDGKPLDHEE